jgi:hypothetical protein
MTDFETAYLRYVAQTALNQLAVNGRRPDLLGAEEIEALRRLVEAQLEPEDPPEIFEDGLGY